MTPDQFTEAFQRAEVNARSSHRGDGSQALARRDELLRHSTHGQLRAYVNTTAPNATEANFELGLLVNEHDVLVTRWL